MLMTNEVMAKFNMKGGKGKLAFTKLRLFTVVRESVRRTTAETEASIAAAVAFCLKYAPDRVGEVEEKLFLKLNFFFFIRGPEFGQFEFC
ncbi:hypothetical protein UPYG_G00054810 [Umbra pygmaea]|uniref:Uncharacterized protein n=1 Tax=Umbra pygmaea TaxID=75934 RepID=A0ABD0XB47_UMBPY